MTKEKGSKPSKRKPRVAKISKPEAIQDAASAEAVEEPQPYSEAAPPKSARTVATEKARGPSKGEPRIVKVFEPEATQAPTSPEAVEAPQLPSPPSPPSPSGRAKPARKVTTEKGRGASKDKPRVATITKPDAAQAVASPEAVQASQPPPEPAPAPSPIFVLPEEVVGVVERQPELETRASRPPAEGAGPAADEPLVSGADERWLVAADLGSLSVIGGLVFLNIAGTGGTVRLGLALLFVTFVPGWALARAAGLAGGLTGVAVAVLASLTIGAAASTVMVWANIWHPLMLLAGLGALSAVAILWTLPPAFAAAQLRR